MARPATPAPASGLKAASTIQAIEPATPAKASHSQPRTTAMPSVEAVTTSTWAASAYRFGSSLETNSGVA